MTGTEHTEADRSRFVCNLIAAGGLIICGAVLLVFGIAGDAIGVSVVSLIAPVILLCIGLALLVTSLLRRNTVTLYVSVLLLMCSAASFCANLIPGVSYATIWPMYVVAPAVASFFTMLMSGAIRFHVRIICVFAVPSVFFSLFAAGIWSVGILIPVLIIYIGLLALFAALAVKGEPEE